MLEENGLWVDVPDHISPDCCVRYVKFEKRNEAIHRLSYCCRKPVEDLVSNLTESDLDDFDKDFVRFLLDYTPRRVNLGFLTNLKRFGYSRKPTPMRCPICGGEMKPELNKRGDKRLYPRPPPDVPHLFRTKSGKWREQVDPVIRR